MRSFRSEICLGMAPSSFLLDSSIALRTSAKKTMQLHFMEIQANLKLPLWWALALTCLCGPPDKPCFQVFSRCISCTVVLPLSTAPEHLWCTPHRSCHLPWGKAECMHAAIVRLLLYEDYVWVSLGNAMKAKQSKAKQSKYNNRQTIYADVDSP